LSSGIGGSSSRNFLVHRSVTFNPRVIGHSPSSGLGSGCNFIPISISRSAFHDERVDIAATTHRNGHAARRQSLDRMTFFKIGKIWFSQLLPLNTP
jgi:hypothetical protein